MLLLNSLNALCFNYMLHYYVLGILMYWYEKITTILLGRKNMIENNVYGFFIVCVQRGEGGRIHIYIYYNLWNNMFETMKPRKVVPCEGEIERRMWREIGEGVSLCPHLKIFMFLFETCD